MESFYISFLYLLQITSHGGAHASSKLSTLASKSFFFSIFMSRDFASTGSVGSADPPDFLKLYYENAIKSKFSDLRGKFLEGLRSLTSLTFGPRGVPD